MHSTQPTGCPYGPPWFHSPGGMSPAMSVCEKCMHAAITACQASGGGSRLVSGYYPAGRDWGWGPSLACSGPSGPYFGPTTSQGQTTWMCFNHAQQQSMMKLSSGQIIHVFVAP